MTNQIFELADIAGILGIEKSCAKSWTIGRPFSVRPSIRAASGKGSRNLFSRNDVYRFALVKRLNEAGAPVAAIKTMLEKLEPDLTGDTVWRAGSYARSTPIHASTDPDILPSDPQREHWVVIDLKSSRGPDLLYDVEVLEVYAEAFRSTPQPERDIVCRYAVNLKSIADDVSTKIDLYSRQQKGQKEKRPKRRQR
jgi:DNA-binding transcriptional MerR regulator